MTLIERRLVQKDARKFSDSEGEFASEVRDPDVWPPKDFVPRAQRAREKRVSVWVQNPKIEKSYE